MDSVLGTLASFCDLALLLKRYAVEKQVSFEPVIHLAPDSTLVLKLNQQDETFDIQDIRYYFGRGGCQRR
jgi:hypothetical protein